MWIRFKPECALLDSDAKWKRIRYLDWIAKDMHSRAQYETRNEPAPNPKQREGLLKGRIIRHVKATQAQAHLALRKLRELEKLTGQSTMTEVDLALAISNMCVAYNGALTAVTRLRIAEANMKKVKEPKQTS